MCNVAEASQNAYLVLIFYHYPCLKRSDQSYIYSRCIAKNSSSKKAGMIEAAKSDVFRVTIFVSLPHESNEVLEPNIRTLMNVVVF